MQSVAPADVTRPSSEIIATNCDRIATNFDRIATNSQRNAPVLRWNRVWIPDSPGSRIDPRGCEANL